MLLAIGAAVRAAVVLSPYPPNDSYRRCRPTCRRRWTTWMGTTSRGQDLFWLLTFAIRNTLLFGITVAVISRIAARW